MMIVERSRINLNQPESVCGENYSLRLRADIALVAPTDYFGFYHPLLLVGARLSSLVGMDVDKRCVESLIQ